MKKYILSFVFLFISYWDGAAQNSQAIEVSTGYDMILNVENSFVEPKRTFIARDNRIFHTEIGHAWRRKRWEVTPSIGYFNYSYIYNGKYGGSNIATAKGISLGVSGGYYFHVSEKWSGLVSPQIRIYNGIAFTGAGGIASLVNHLIIPALSATFFIPLGSDKWQAFLKPSIGFRYREKEFPAGLTAGIQYRYRSKP